jgi:hypothetical protein
MALVADSNFTNNLTSVAAFSPFPTGGGNKILEIDNSGVLLDNAVAVSNISTYDLYVDALLQSGSPSGVRDFGFVLNRTVSGAFYYLRVLPSGTPQGKAEFKLFQYSGGVGGSFSAVSVPTDNIQYISTNTIFTFRARVESTSRGPNISLLINDVVVLSHIDISGSALNSGQVGLAGGIINNQANSLKAYFDNWFVRSAD